MLQKSKAKDLGVLQWKISKKEPLYLKKSLNVLLIGLEQDWVWFMYIISLEYKYFKTIDVKWQISFHMYLVRFLPIDVTTYLL